MSALLFLLRCFIVNKIKEIFRKKSILIAYVMVLAFFAVIFLTTGSTQAGSIRNLDVFGAFLIGVFLMIFLLSISQGLKRGTAIFTMPDVNLLFTAPIHTRKVLLYGVGKQAGILVLASFFLIAQYNTIRMSFGVGGQAIAGLMIAYVLLGIFSQLLSANLYAFCASHSQWRARVDLAVKLILVALAAGVFIFAMVRGADIVNSLRGFLGSEAWNYVPAIGWARALTIRASTGLWLNAASYCALLLLGCGAMLIWLAKSNEDFYEDVLFAAETAKATKEAAKSGKFLSSGTVSKRVKRELPPLKGMGASVFFYRTMREEARRGYWVFSLATIAAVGAPIFGMIMQSVDGPAETGMWPVLIFAAYLLVFLSSVSGSIGRELAQHYIFLAPCSAFGKLAAMSTPQLIKSAVDSVVFFAAVMLLIKPDLSVALGASLVYFSIGATFTSGILLVEKLLSSMQSKMLIIMLYLLILAVLVAPGFVLGIILDTFLPFRFLGYLGCALWNLMVSALITYLCRNLLHSMSR